MMIMTAKVDLKKIAVILGSIAAVILALILLFGGSEAQTTSATVSGNEGRVKFLRDLGWEVTDSPLESGQIRIPQEKTEVFDRYNKLQISQGYDLTPYAGKNAMRYVYRIHNFPGAGEDPVYATVLVHKNRIIGGDITDTAPGGKVQGFKKPQPTPEATAPAA